LTPKKGFIATKKSCNKKHSGLECPKLVSADRSLRFLLLNWVKLPVPLCTINLQVQENSAKILLVKLGAHNAEMGI